MPHEKARLFFEEETGTGGNVDASFLQHTQQRLETWLEATACSSLPPSIKGSTEHKSALSTPITSLSDKRHSLKMESKKKIVLVTAGGTTGEKV